ncbi:FG-GAP-like repeat-containing protein [uncultured Dokdonia sp.]|uniref:FG-GAP-like repeat-containing protein n=1 Tax=uncultured Dokdonia sp. TaxID=575653 RepID=UPI002631D8B0|nr:FG-GAP-like repeat-containing protein [uncultured Dokdonia sp.]
MKNRIHISCLLFIFSFSITSAQVFFNEQSQTLGLTGSSWGEDGNENFGGGISFFDFDDDGWDDLTVSSNEGLPIRFYKNNNGTFELLNIPGINDDLFETKSVQWVDIDNDGDYDFFASSNQVTGDSRLYENQGDLTFVNITVAAGLSNPGHQSFGASWGDYNKDGFLDLFLVSRFFDTDTQFNKLYKNNGDNTFTDVSVEAQLIQENSLSFCSAWIDYDKDGWQDIYISNDKIQNENILYHNNQDGTFTNVAEAANANVAIDAMSTTIGDYNNDGWLDIYIANTQTGNAFLKNNGDGTFTDVAPNNGTLFESVAWSSVFLDADHDKDLDLYVSASVTNVDSVQLSAAFYQNNGDGLYTIPNNAGFDDDIAISYGNAIGDVDNDGKYDIAVLNCLPEDVFLWKNESENDHNWIKVKLEGTESNRQGIGALIELSYNDEKQYNYVLCGEGYLSQNSSYEFFGIGDDTAIDFITIYWPSGIEDVVTNPQINTTLTVIEGDPQLGLEEIHQEKVAVFPNPSTSILHISGMNNYVNGALQIIDMSGRVVQTILITDANMILDIASLTKGMYMLQMRYGEVTTHKKILKM